ncbi:sterol desaturase family protein [Flavobacterium granuli]|uniref:Sterol desaturase/sphingolipid hydroxylase (Fatty acid hydroxylase superfamily) n=1 Tax=Flavobacterium granuli TaxID=280093 RepID=A0ABU1S6S5_9FLAO|nr:sterol desaturase family protein [Flavobacterium granuli]MDR6846730.1 sterol desaturase/sphingolipid hydroxylase (fatty acid hydroxylase superfamily) [Flavobacterium granuli]
MKLNYIAFAIPFFASFMLLEYYISKRKNRNVHHFNESVANLNVGIVERITDLLTTGTFYFIFSWLNANFSIFSIESSATTWILLFFATDLVWYWYHRLGHTVNVFWATHIVHHQSDDFNYTAAARITVFQAVARGLFWCVLPIIGFKAEMITVLLLIHGTYPFFTHTQLVGKLGWLEYIIVTPSHHRVHHSSNPEYLDKNYGDMLIIWDKFFGTYIEETTEPQYGLTKSLESYSFLWQHFHYVLELTVAFRMAKTFRKKLNVIFGGPNDIDERIRVLLERKFSNKTVDIQYSKKLINAIISKTIITMGVLFFTILFSEYITASVMFLLAGFIVLSVIVTGAMLEQKKWIFHLEFLRIGIVSYVVLSFFPNLLLLSVIVLLGIVGVLFYQTIHSKYQDFLFSA